MTACPALVANVLRFPFAVVHPPREFRQPAMQQRAHRFFAAPHLGSDLGVRVAEQARHRDHLAMVFGQLGKRSLQAFEVLVLDREAAGGRHATNARLGNAAAPRWLTARRRRPLLRAAVAPHTMRESELLEPRPREAELMAADAGARRATKCPARCWSTNRALLMRLIESGQCCRSSCPCAIRRK